MALVLNLQDAEHAALRILQGCHGAGRPRRTPAPPAPRRRLPRPPARPRTRWIRRNRPASQLLVRPCSSSGSASSSRSASSSSPGAERRRPPPRRPPSALCTCRRRPADTRSPHGRTAAGRIRRRPAARASAVRPRRIAPGSLYRPLPVCVPACQTPVVPPPGGSTNTMTPVSADLLGAELHGAARVRSLLGQRAGVLSGEVDVPLGGACPATPGAGSAAQRPPPGPRPRRPGSSCGRPAWAGPRSVQPNTAA